MPNRRAPHPLDHQPAFRAVVAATTPVATLATRINRMELVSALAIACSDLGDGFAAPPDSRRRVAAHRRAWLAIKEVDRALVSCRRDRRLTAATVQRAQRAIDNADVLVGALLPSALDDVALGSHAAAPAVRRYAGPALAS